MSEETTISATESKVERIGQLVYALLRPHRLGHLLLFATGIFVAVSAIEDFQVFVPCAWPAKETLGMGSAIDTYRMCEASFRSGVSSSFITAVATGISVALGAFLVILGTFDDRSPRVTTAMRAFCILLAVFGSAWIIASFRQSIIELRGVGPLTIGFITWVAIVVLLPVLTDLGPRIERKQTTVRSWGYLLVSLVAATIAGLHQFSLGWILFGLCCVILLVFASVLWRRESVQPRRWEGVELIPKRQRQNRRILAISVLIVIAIIEMAAKRFGRCEDSVTNRDLK